MRPADKPGLPILDLTWATDQKGFVGVDKVGRVVSWIGYHSSFTPARHRHWVEIFIVVIIIFTHNTREQLKH